MGDGKGMGTMGIALLLFGIRGYGLVDVLRRPDYVFRAHSHGKTLWVALQIFLLPLGTFLYLGLVWGRCGRLCRRQQAGHARDR